MRQRYRNRYLAVEEGQGYLAREREKIGMRTETGVLLQRRWRHMVTQTDGSAGEGEKVREMSG